MTQSSWSRVTGVLFDADDTLYDTRAAMHVAGAVAAGHLWPGADPERVGAAGVRFRDDPEGWFAAYTRGEIEFVKPGRGVLTAQFAVSPEKTAELRERARGGAKVLEWFETSITDRDGDVVARVRREVYVREKRGPAAA